jgi:hypothetical protein
MRRIDLWDLVALCISVGRSFQQTLSLISQAWRLEKQGSAGKVSGFKFQGLDFECVDPKHFKSKDSFGRSVKSVWPCQFAVDLRQAH